ncbi:MAG: hypothetical protein ACFFD4_09665 [Candidatus Odinarchaeota archaeon]
MFNKPWYHKAWKYADNKGRLMLIFGFVSLVLVFLGVFIILLGVVMLFTIVGVPDPNTDAIFLFFTTGFIVIVLGVVAMIMYLIGMRFVRPPVIPEEDILKYEEEMKRKEEERENKKIKPSDIALLRAELEKKSEELDLQDLEARQRYEWFQKQCTEYDKGTLRIELFNTYLKMYKGYVEKK